MAKQTINIGSAANDGTGTPARDAFDICNDNFTELYTGSAVAEGTAILSTGEVGGTKFLREDGDGTSSWQAIPAPEGTSVLSTGPVTDGYVLTADGAGGAAWEAAAGGGAFTADAQTQITPTTPIVLDEATGDEIALDLSYQTNKAAGSDTGLRINQTDTSSPGTSNLLDLQVGGTSIFRVQNNATGVRIIEGTASGRTHIRIPDFSGIQSQNGRWGSFSDTSNQLVWFDAGITIGANGYFGFSDTNNNAKFGTADTKLYRDAANTLALRNGTSAQTFNVYNTYTDSNHYERGFMKWNTNVLEIGTEAAGTGSARDINLTLNGTTKLRIFSASNYVAFGSSTAAAYISTQQPTATTPNIVPYGSFDSNTGIGQGAADQMSLIAGGDSVLKIIKDTGNAVEFATGQTVSGLPTTPRVGMVARVTDADTPVIGNTVTGGGAAYALVNYNGSNWTVIGV